MEEQRHIGTGRAGTTFLVQLLTNLGLDTGFDKNNMRLEKHARAGLEYDIRDENSPYIVKCPWFIDHVEEVMSRKDIVIDHIYVPIRDVQAAAQSRRQVVKDSRKEYSLIKRLLKSPTEIAGGLWGTTNENEQETILLKKIYDLLLSVSAHQIPITFIKYPKLTMDGIYLYNKLQFMLDKIDLDAFMEIYNTTVKPEFVHQFSHNDI